MNNILFLYKLLFKFKKVLSPLCSFCNSAEETPLHIFYTCNITKGLWNQLQYFVSQYFHIPEITPQSALVEFFNIGNQQQNFLLMNHLVLIFKHYLYMSREHGAACFTSLKSYLVKIKITEQNFSPCSSQKKEKCQRKWNHWKNSEINRSLEFLLLLFSFFYALRIYSYLLILILSTFLLKELKIPLLVLCNGIFFQTVLPMWL